MTLNPNHLTSSEYFELIKTTAFKGYRIDIPLPDSVSTLIALQHHLMEWYILQQCLHFRDIISDNQWCVIEKVYDQLYSHIYPNGESECEYERELE